MHNVHHMLAMMGSLRAAILQDRFPDFLRKFFKTRYGDYTSIPQWAVTALRGVGVDLLAG